MPRQPAKTTVRDALDSALIALTAAGCEQPRLDGELLLAAAMETERAALIADPGRAVEPAAARRFAEFSKRRREREPVAYILGTKGFRQLDLAIDARVLIPRPETEHVVEAALDLPHRARVCDVGTGSGALALALASERPDLRIVATDASADALDVARTNAGRLGLAVEFHFGDLLADVGTDLDAIVSNPPYVADADLLAPEIVRYEPALALRAGPEGLDVIARLLPAAGATRAQKIISEIGVGQLDPVAEMMRAAGFSKVESVRDLAGIERVVIGSR